MRRLLIAFALLATASAEELRMASGHPMQYYASLPQGWTAARKWPVVVVIESANRQFQQTLDVFARARKDMPFILVMPLVTTNGGANYRQAGTYHYSDAVWSRIEQDRCRFDMDGIAAVAADVRKLLGGEDRYFLTGWEAGGHTVWSMILEHPEALRAAAPAVTNYAGRCLDAGFSTDASRPLCRSLSFRWNPGGTLPQACMCTRNLSRRRRPQRTTGSATYPNGSLPTSRTVRWPTRCWRISSRYGPAVTDSEVKFASPLADARGPVP